MSRYDRVISSQRKVFVFNAAATLAYMGTLCVSILALL